MAGYTPLFSSIVRSSIWDEDAKTCKVWVTMLALADADGIVEGALTGLAHEARVSKQECATALRILEAPDPDSKNPANDGRRIQKVEGGWLVLNHAQYRRQARKRAAEYYRQWRAKKKESPAPLKEEITQTHTHTQTGATKRNIATSCATVAHQEEIYSLQEVQDAAVILGISKDYAQKFYEHYQPQGWKWGNGQPITDIRGALQRCHTRGYTFEGRKNENKNPTKAERDAQMDAEIERFKKEGRL